jgi:hypothetical protein
LSPPASAALRAALPAGMAQAEAYGEHLSQWVGRMRADLAEYHPSLPFLMVVMATRDRCARGCGRCCCRWRATRSPGRPLLGLLPFPRQRPALARRRNRPGTPHHPNCRRAGIFPYIATIRAQQQALQLADTVKVDMAGYELYYENGQLIHLTKDGQCALGSALAGAYYAYQAGVQPAPSAR